MARAAPSYGLWRVVFVQTGVLGVGRLKAVRARGEVGRGGTGHAMLCYHDAMTAWQQ